MKCFLKTAMKPSFEGIEGASNMRHFRQLSARVIMTILYFANDSSHLIFFKMRFVAFSFEFY